MKKIFLPILLLILLTHCQTQKKKQDGLCIEPTAFNKVPGWESDDLRPAFLAFKKSCTAFKKQERSKRLGLSMSVGIWHDVCEVAEKVPYKDLKRVRSFFEKNFVPYKCHDKDKNDTGLYTGYYESALRGSLKPSEKHAYPLYKRPPDLTKKDKKYGQGSGSSFAPHHDREAIENGALKGKNLELLWVDCPVDAFFLHIQGSGRVLLEDGRYVRVGYDGANGHPYTAIGKILIERGEIPKKDMSMQAIRDWIKKNPEEGRKLMLKNPSYVFFRFLEQEGAIGAQGVSVSPGRSLAVDRQYIPYGVPVWLDTEHPENDVKIQRLLIAQDTGGAIKGPLRGDVFWGFSDIATKVAGTMKEKGRTYLLLPKRVSFAGCHGG
jgi:membrane-bound lytic murein transglycosylase A